MKAAGRKVEMVRREDFLSSPTCSLLPCLGQLALAVESLRQVLCRLSVAEATSASSTSVALFVTQLSLRILHGSHGRSFKSSKGFNALLAITLCLMELSVEGLHTA